MAMVVDELIPLCQRLGLGRAPRQIGTMGISMGGYGAILFAEKYPELFSAVASISPAIWTSYGQAEGANSRAYASAADFAANDAVTHTAALKGMPVRVASGNSDPFHPGVEALAAALPPSAVVDFQKGCHLGPFFIDQEPPSLAFLGRHLAGQGEGFSNRALLWSGTVVVRSRTFGDARGSRAERIGVAAPVSGRLPPQRRRGPR
jgi:pimeloyl-ACP methyl ester carboxylesterase